MTETATARPELESLNFESYKGFRQLRDTPCMETKSGRNIVDTLGEELKFINDCNKPVGEQIELIKNLLEKIQRIKSSLEEKGFIKISGPRSFKIEPQGQVLGSGEDVRDMDIVCQRAIVSFVNEFVSNLSADLRAFEKFLTKQLQLNDDVQEKLRRAEEEEQAAGNSLGSRHQKALDSRLDSKDLLV